MKSWIVLGSMGLASALIAQDLPAHPTGGAREPAGGGAPPESTVVGPVVVPRSTAHRFQSSVVDDVYEVRVSVPEDYENDEELRPVVFALDGQWNFTLLSDIVGKLSFDGMIPDPIVVGITWAESGFQPQLERLRDFTPEPLANVPGSGGAANFLKVLETEVFPLVESNYRASAERVLTGGSAGGLFVSYALLERPDLFQGYVASSGATSLAQEYFTRRLEEISPRFLGRERAYFSVGALNDNEEEVRGFVDELQVVVGKSRRIVLNVVPGAGHTGNEFFAYGRGLLHAFRRPRLRLSEQFLERYEGDYFDPAAPALPELTIEAGREKLFIRQAGELWPFVFYAETPTHFYAEGIDIDLSFYRDDADELAFTLNLQRSPFELVRR